MKKYKFDSYFVDVSDSFLQVRCEAEDDGGVNCVLLIHTYDDPYKVYYLEGVHPEDIKAFEDMLFDYLRGTYPTHFS